MGHDGVFDGVKGPWVWYTKRCYVHSSYLDKLLYFEWTNFHMNNIGAKFKDTNLSKFTITAHSRCNQQENFKENSV